jgi:hypothetical protein
LSENFIIFFGGSPDPDAEAMVGADCKEQYTRNKDVKLKMMLQSQIKKDCIMHRQKIQMR